MPVTLDRRSKGIYPFGVFHTSLGSTLCTNFELKENTSYSAMLNIREPVPHPESLTTNSSDSGITSTRYPTEFLPIPSNSGIPIYMDDRQAISLKHASNSRKEFRNCIETESVPGIPEFIGIPSNSHQFRFYLIPEFRGGIAFCLHPHYRLCIWL